MRPLLLCLALAPRPGVDPAKVDAAIDRGVDWLLSMQRLDGSWACGEPWIYPDGATGLALYALLKCGVPGDHAAARRAAAFLERHPPPTRIYSAACSILALAERDPTAHRPAIEALARFLSEERMSFLWAYPTGDADLSNTQYAVLGLHVAATRARVRVPAKLWEETAHALVERQQDDGGFAYNVASKPTGSMTVAGLAMLAIARAHLEEEKRIGALGPPIAEAMRRAQEWLARAWTPSMNPEPSLPGYPKKWNERWLYYWLYGVERAAAYAGFARLGGRDWYEEGAEVLLKRQDGDGHWGGAGAHEEEPNTAFALLFLRRASAPSTGATRPKRWAKTFGLDDPKAAFSIRAEGGSRMRLFVTSWGGLARVHEWKKEEGRGPRVARVAYLEGERVLAEVAGDPSRPAHEDRFPAEVDFASNGKRTVRARATLLAPGGEERVVESAPVALEVFDVIEEGDRGILEDAPRNLVRGTDVKVEASSTNPYHWWHPNRAADGEHATGWVAANEDADPWIRLTFDRPLLANRVTLSHAVYSGRQRGWYDRATEVAVLVNGARRARAKLDPDDFRRHSIDLGGTCAVQALEVHVLARAPGSKEKGVVGFQEIELFRDPTKRAGR